MSIPYGCIDVTEYGDPGPSWIEPFCGYCKTRRRDFFCNCENCGAPQAASFSVLHKTLSIAEDRCMVVRRKPDDASLSLDTATV